MVSPPQSTIQWPCGAGLLTSKTLRTSETHQGACPSGGRRECGEVSFGTSATYAPSAKRVLKKAVTRKNTRKNQLPPAPGHCDHSAGDRRMGGCAGIVQHHCWGWKIGAITPPCMQPGCAANISPHRTQLAKERGHCRLKLEGRLPALQQKPAMLQRSLHSPLENNARCLR